MRKKYRPRMDWHSILSPEFLSLGYGLRFWYPTRNRFGVPIEYSYRTISVTDVQFLRGAGIAAEWIKREPLIRRGSWLITGIDFAIYEERSFYWEAMHHPLVRDAGVVKANQTYPPPPPRKAFPLPALRLGYHVPGEFIEWVSQPFAPTRRDRLSLYETLLRQEESGFDLFSGLQLAAFPVRACA